MKTKTLLIAAVMFLGLTAASFAQATFTVGSIPVTTVIATGVTEKTGDITFTTVPGSGATVTGTLTISYGVPITNDTTTITITTGSIPWTGTLPSINQVNNLIGQVVITVPSGGTGTFTLTGVRVAISGTGLTSLSASLSSTGNAITAQETTVQVISAIKDAILSASNTSSLTINPLTGAASGTASLVVKDAFLNGFGVSEGPNYGVLLRFTLSAAPPTGTTIQFGTATSTVSNAGTGVSTWSLTSCDGLQAAATGTVTSATTPLTVCYQNTTRGSDTKVNLETVTVSVSATGNASLSLLPLGPTTINWTVSLAPLGTAFNNGAIIPTPVPRYTALEVASANPLVGVPGSTTTLLMPYGQVIKNLGYDTGIAIANTTTDPGKTAMGFGSAIPLSGTITFYMYQQRAVGATSNPAVIKYTTTAGSPGSGLDAAGNLPSGSTYVVLLGQVLAAAGATGDFSGQIFVITNFTNAHALYVISNFTNFSQGSLALVIPGDRSSVSAPVSPANSGPERLSN